MHFISMNLGVLDWLIEKITELFLWLVDVIMFLIQNVLGGVLFGIGAQLMSLIDFSQNIFRILAGLDTSYSGIESNSSDLIMQMLFQRNVLDVLLALSILSVCIVMIATIIQIIRSEYTTEGAKNTKATIFATSIKSLVMFFIVPLFSVMGIILSNFLLRAIDAATQVGKTSNISNSIFIASAYNANCFRTPTESDLEDSKTQAAFGDLSMHIDGKDGSITWKFKNEDIKIGYKYRPEDPQPKYIDRLNNITENTEDVTASGTYNAADLIDLLFKGGYYVWAEGPGAEEFLEEANINALKDGSTIIRIDSVYTYTNGSLVKMFYKTSNMNFVILFFGCFFCIYALFTAAFGMAKRMFKAVLLILISPPIVGMMPLDGGKAFGTWKKTFISEVLMAYGVVVSLNIFFLLLPMLQSINIFDPATTDETANLLAQLIFIIVGCLMVKDTPKLIGGLIGAGDAISTGASTMKSVGRTVSNVGHGMAAAGHGVASIVNKGRAIATGYMTGDSDRVKQLNAQAEYHKQQRKSHNNVLTEQVKKATGITSIPSAEKPKKDKSVAASRKRVKEGKGSIMDRIRAKDTGLIGSMNKVFRPYQSSLDYATQKTSEKSIASETLRKQMQGEIGKLYKDKDYKNLSEEQKKAVDKELAPKIKEIQDKYNSQMSNIMSSRKIGFDKDGNLELHRTLKQTLSDNIINRTKNRYENAKYARAIAREEMSNNGLERTRIENSSRIKELKEDIKKAKEKGDPLSLARIDNLKAQIRELEKENKDIDKIYKAGVKENKKILNESTNNNTSQIAAGKINQGINEKGTNMHREFSKIQEQAEKKNNSSKK